MEAATLPARPAVRGDRVKAFIGTYGLILLLLALPVYFGIDDLVHDGNLTRLGNNLVAGVSNGAIWALVAIGYTLVYGIVELINFAHGEIFMIGSFISAAFFMTIGLTEDTNAGVLFFGLLRFAAADHEQRHQSNDVDRQDAINSQTHSRAALGFLLRSGVLLCKRT